MKTKALLTAGLVALSVTTSSQAFASGGYTVTCICWKLAKNEIGHPNPDGPDMLCELVGNELDPKRGTGLYTTQSDIGLTAEGRKKVCNAVAASGVLVSHDPQPNPKRPYRCIPACKNLLTSELPIVD